MIAAAAAAPAGDVPESAAPARPAACETSVPDCCAPRHSEPTCGGSSPLALLIPPEPWELEEL
eukprot:4038433-Alexandrium_andersonii.AAC.1